MVASTDSGHFGKRKGLAAGGATPSGEGKAVDSGDSGASEEAKGVAAEEKKVLPK